MPVIPVHFNSALDKRLETNPGIPGDGDRIKSMTLAVQAWNEVLRQMGARQTIVLTTSTDFMQPFAALAVADRTCVDEQLPDKAIVRHRWQLQPQVIASTAQGMGGFASGPGGPGMGFNGFQAGEGPGWVINPLDISDATDALGVASLQGSPIAMAGIAWMTHELPRGMKQCRRIHWSYAVANNVPQNNYDFYSVMLHEVGHVLGLEHQNGQCGGQNGNLNVMRPTIARGIRSGISDCEIDALTKLYGRGGMCEIR